MKYNVKVVRRGDFVRPENDGLVVGIRSVPEKGKANAEIIQKIAKYFGVSQSRVYIISGATSRHKVIEIDV